MQQKKLSIMIITVLSLSLVLTSGMALNGVLPGIRDALGISQSESELIVTISPIASVVAVLSSAFTYRLFGMKRSVILGLLLIGIGGFVPVVIHHYPAILAGRFIFGLGMGTVSPMAVNYINLLVEPQLRPTIQGYRMSSSLIGQGVLTLAAGALFMISWNLAAVVYLIAFIVAFMVWKFIPDLKMEQTHSEAASEKLHLPAIMIPIILFQVAILITAVAVEVRFPALLAYAMGGEFNSSFIIAIKATLGILAGAVFGKLYSRLRQAVLYAGIGILILSTILMAVSAGSSILIIGAFLLMSLVHAWIPAYVITTISKHTHPRNRTVAMSIFFAATNIGVFSMPFVVNGVEALRGYNGLTAPYGAFALFLVIMFIVVVLFRETVYKKKFRGKV